MKHRIGGSPTGAFGSAVKLSHLRSKPRSASSAGSEDRDLTLQACDLVNILVRAAVEIRKAGSAHRPILEAQGQDFGIPDRIE